MIYKKMHTRKGAIIGLLAGSIIAIALAIAGNLVITPLYAHMTVSQVVALIIPALLPFNIIKLALHVVVTMLIYKPISNLLHENK
ncbi:hypothetical membrane protein [Gardnerella vaginalis AMD]|nr:hypothetical membrane protein [Gardnerella vaginalis AMD]